MKSLVNRISRICLAVIIILTQIQPYVEAHAKSHINQAIMKFNEGQKDLYGPSNGTIESQLNNDFEYRNRWHAQHRNAVEGEMQEEDIGQDLKQDINIQGPKAGRKIEQQVEEQAPTITEIIEYIEGLEDLEAAEIPEPIFTYLNDRYGIVIDSETRYEFVDEYWNVFWVEEYSVEKLINDCYTDGMTRSDFIVELQEAASLEKIPESALNEILADKDVENATTALHLKNTILSKAKYIYTLHGKRFSRAGVPIEAKSLTVSFKLKASEEQEISFTTEKAMPLSNGNIALLWKESVKETETSGSEPIEKETLRLQFIDKNGKEIGNIYDLRGEEDLTKHVVTTLDSIIKDVNENFLVVWKEEYLEEEYPDGKESEKEYPNRLWTSYFSKEGDPIMIKDKNANNNIYLLSKKGYYRTRWNSSKRKYVTDFVKKEYIDAWITYTEILPNGNLLIVWYGKKIDSPDTSNSDEGSQQLLILRPNGQVLNVDTGTEPYPTDENDFYGRESISSIKGVTVFPDKENPENTKILIFWYAGRWNTITPGLMMDTIDVNGKKIGETVSLFRGKNDGFNFGHSWVWIRDSGKLLNDEFFIIWKESYCGGLVARIFMQKFRSDGTPIGDPVALTEDRIPHDGDFQKALQLSNGYRVITWWESSTFCGDKYGPNVPGNHLYFKVLDENGNFVDIVTKDGNKIATHELTLGLNAGNLSVITMKELSDGRIALITYDKTAAGYWQNIRLHIFEKSEDENGKIIIKEQDRYDLMKDAYTNSISLSPEDIHFMADGNISLTWQETRWAYSGSEKSYYYNYILHTQVFDINANPVGDNHVLAKYFSWNKGFSYMKKTVAFPGEEYYFVVWRTSDTKNIWAQIYDQGGNPVGNKHLLNGDNSKYDELEIVDVVPWFSKVGEKPLITTIYKEKEGQRSKYHLKRFNIGGQNELYIPETNKITRRETIYPDIRRSVRANDNNSDFYLLKRLRNNRSSYSLQDNKSKRFNADSTNSSGLANNGKNMLFTEGEVMQQDYIALRNNALNDLSDGLYIDSLAAVTVEEKLEDLLSALKSLENKTEIEKNMIETIEIVLIETRYIDKESLNKLDETFDKFEEALQFIRMVEGMKEAFKGTKIASKIMSIMATFVGGQSDAYDAFVLVTQDIYKRIEEIFETDTQSKEWPEECIFLARRNIPAGKKALIKRKVILDRILLNEEELTNKKVLTKEEKAELAELKKKLDLYREQYAIGLKTSMTAFVESMNGIKEDLKEQGYFSILYDSYGMKAVFLIDKTILQISQHRSDNRQQENAIF